MSLFSTSHEIPATMRAARIHRFGSPEVVSIEEIDVPYPGDDEVLLRVAAAGVGPWDRLMRVGKILPQKVLPLTLGSDVAGVVERVGSKAGNFVPGDAIYGVANARFTDGYADYVVAPAGMIAQKPAKLSYPEAASTPIVAVMAWQMLFDHGHAGTGQTVFVHGGAGSVGAFAVQLARQAQLRVIASAFDRDADYVRGLGANDVIDVDSARIADFSQSADLVIDTVGGKTQGQLFALAKPGGIIVSSVSPPDSQRAQQLNLRSAYFIVEVNTTQLAKLGAMFDAGELVTSVGTVLPLAEARAAHEMLEGTRPHGRRKIVLQTGR